MASKLKLLAFFRSIKQGFPLAPCLYVLLVKAFNYLLVRKNSQVLVHRILLPSNHGKSINDHFIEYPLLTLKKGFQLAFQALSYSHTFYKALSSSIQLSKTSCYRQYPQDMLDQLDQYQWQQIHPREIFKFFYVLFSFQNNFCISNVPLNL